MADNDKLYTNNPHSKSNANGVSSLIRKDGGGLLSDLKKDVIDFGASVVKSTKDRFTLKGDRQKIEDSIEFNTREVSIANRHVDAITAILNNTFNGNLFDAGVNTLNLLNFGTKWKISYTQDVDKNIYPYKYIYYYGSNNNSNVENNQVTEGDINKNPDNIFLETIEDPTILGFTLKIDFNTSPLFKGVVETSTQTPKNNPKISFNNEVTEGDEDSLTKNFSPSGIKGQSVNQKKMNENIGIRNSALEFISKYKDQHPEMNYATAYLLEFSKICTKIFVSPESEKDYNKVKYKNSYIYEIKGLDKLDNPFVEYDSENNLKEVLELTLGEDIRMYVNRLAFLYRNLTWSYNMGKKLIPENRLRFNIYIKVSDIRNFTTNDKNENYKYAVRNGYSRVIYELKDCEFFFDKSILPESLSMGGFESVNDKFADLKLKIKYRKVNRIFYSEFFSNNFSPFIIGDKFYTPNTKNTFKDLESMKFSPADTLKRNETDNNIPVVESLNSKFDRLKNKGLFNEDDNDTALGRFVKSVGNKAIKAGSTIIDDKVQAVKGEINDFGRNLFNNNLSSKVRDLLKEKIQIKSKELGRSLHFNTSKQFSNINEVVDYSSVNSIDVKTPLEDLHPNTLNIIKVPKEDVHPNIKKPILNPNEDLHINKDFKIISPKEDLHLDIDNKILIPNEDMHPNFNNLINNPNSDLHPDIDNVIKSPLEDLHPNTELLISNPKEDLHQKIEFGIYNPNENLHGNIENIVNFPKENLHNTNNEKIVSPDEILHNNINNLIKIPIQNSNVVNNVINNPDEILHDVKKSKIESPSQIIDDVNFVVHAPNENVHDKTKSKIESPNENVNNFSKWIKKNIQSPPQDKNEC